MQNLGERQVKFKIVVEGLKLPRLNEVLRWPWYTRAKEVKRVRGLVQDSALYAHGLAGAVPLSKAQVCITAFGDYSRYDSDGVFWKDAIDSIVARPFRKMYGKDVGRRWGLVIDDSPKVIGQAETKWVEAKDYRLEIEVFEC